MPSVPSIAAIPTLIWSASTAIEKGISVRFGTALTSLMIVGLGIIPMLIYYLIHPIQISFYYSILSALSGLFFACGALLYYKTLETEQVSNTVASGFVQPALILAFSILILHETVSIFQAISGVIIVSGVLLVITTKNLKVNVKILPAVLANASWGIYWIIASTAILGANTIGMTLLISRTSTFAVLLIAFFLFLRTKSAGKIGNKLIMLVVIAGILDGFGNLFFGFLVSQNLVAVAAIFNTAQPILVTGIAYLFMKERLTKIQGAGMALAVIGALSLALAI